MRQKSKLIPLFLMAATAACLPASASFTAPRAHEMPPAVRVVTEKDGDVTHFYVENHELCEVTMTFDLGLVNLKSTGPTPYTATFPAQRTTEAFALEPVNPERRWEYSYTNYYKLGSNLAHHDDSYVYQLPYAPGSLHKVTQAFGGAFSHKGSNLYAIDWQMPEGTPVYAARGGVVVRTTDDSNTGGGNIRFDPFNNYVLIRHDDGTLGHYCHLKRGGVCVVPGQVVKAGDLIAHSGSTGFSTGPHLHFCVFKTINGRQRVSIPIKFRTADGQAAILVEGRRYRAPSIQTASVPTPLAKAGTPAPAPTL
ncbi:MAG TPA: M23 family metallopeptidase [Verrucomicrobiae bacterium]|nr:M23 family metallopeptidase [Verrucomicrobiae bacterium]